MVGQIMGGSGAVLPEFIYSFIQQLLSMFLKVPKFHWINQTF